jgi:biopolymer transport protein ExbD
MRLQDEPEAPFQINIVPMIDVIFSILAFFIMSTLFLTRTEGLSVNLPKAKTAEVQQKTRITVSIDDQGQVSLNRKPIQANALVAGIQGLMQPNQEALVIVNADERVNHGLVVGVMDQVRQIKGAKLAIAAQRR